jgi:hypothetical protein
MYRLAISDRDYTDWNWFDQNEQPALAAATAAATALAIQPCEHKLLHGDLIELAEEASAKFKIIDSPYRQQAEIPGVLIIDGNTYGRGTGRKLLYKCIPDAIHLPCFLVPYEEKIEFNKTKVNKYVTFRLKEWTTKHPVGTLVQTYGNTSDIEAYTQYQLECKALNDNIKALHAMTLRALRETTLGPIPLYYENTPIEDRRQTHTILSIDPPGCVDIDDAIGIQRVGEHTKILSIYIANVPMILEYYNIWEHLTDRISTIYLPTKKIPMLPVALSDHICSLREKEDRVAFAMDVHINHSRVTAIKFNSVLIKVEKNCAYEEPALRNHAAYKDILDTVRALNGKIYKAYLPNIASSHEVVEYCMLLMNHECAKQLKAKNRGIFRSALLKNKTAAAEYEDFPTNVKHIIQNAAGEYCAAAHLRPHELIGVECYVHITSPIRRLVDCVNMLEMQEAYFKKSAGAMRFSAKWHQKIAELNTKTRAIRKLQNEVALLSCHQKNEQQVYAGIVFDKTAITTTTTTHTRYKYRIYITELKLLTALYTDKNVENYATVNVTTHFFLEEAKMTKKIRLQML